MTCILFRKLTLHLCVINNMVALTIDPADTELSSILTRQFIGTAQAWKLPSDVMQKMGIYHGKW